MVVLYAVSITLNKRDCLQCGVPFLPNAKRKTCSDECKRRYQSALKLAGRPDYTCKQCGKIFNAWKRCATFCSRDCSFAHMARCKQERRQKRATLREQALAPRPCAICEGIFEPVQTNQRLCGRRECSLEDGRRKSLAFYRIERAALGPTLTKQCKQCALPFTVERTNGCGCKLCSSCAKANAWISHRDNKTHRDRARKANVPYVSVSRAAVIAKYGRKCWICRRLIQVKPESLAESFSLDHVVPLSLGGWHNLTNVRPAHHRCNSLRGNEYKGQLMLTMVSPLLSGTW
jgi:hypothetical protein